MSSRLYIALAASLALAGCDQLNKDSAQTDDATNPNYKQAQQDLDNNNPSGAIADYEAALAANPKLAGAHYELGMIYGDKMNDPVSSIFHFKRFIDLAPTSDKKDQVQALIDKESAVFAASLPSSNSATTPSADDVAKLQAENTSLKKQVDDATATITKLQEQLSKHHNVAAEPPPAPTPVATDTPAPAASDSTASPATSADATSTNTPPAPPRAMAVDTNNPAAVGADTSASGTNGAPVDLANARSYKVVSGDSYWKIAKKMYPGDTKNGVAKIQEANKQTMGKPLRIGQVLVIPQ